MKVLKTFLLGITLFIGLGSVQAQEKAKLTPQQRADKHTERMVKQLSLDDNQKAKVYEINLGTAMKNERVRSNADLSLEKKREMIKSHHDIRMEQLKGVLTADQYKKLEEHQAEKKAKREAKKEELKKKKKKSLATEELEEL